MEEALRAKLLAAAAISAIVANRVDWGLRPQGDPLPGMELFKVTGLPDMIMSGPSGLVFSRVQVNCWGRDFADAKLLRRAVDKELLGFRGTVGDIRFAGIFPAGERDTTDSDEDGALFNCIRDLTIQHTDL